MAVIIVKQIMQCFSYMLQNSTDLNGIFDLYFYLTNFITGYNLTNMHSFEDILTT